MTLLKLAQVSKHYHLGDNIIKALDKISLEVQAGEFLSIMGPSGSGKSTFLQVASMLSQATSGTIYLKGKDVTSFNEVERSKLRNQEIGFIFQQFNLLPRTSALDNVALPLVYAGVSEQERNAKAEAMLKKVGMGDRLKNTPAQLSGGQQQRVAVARALVNNPAILFADEPTGNLDSENSQEINDLLTELHQEGKTIIMVTHEPDDAKIAQRLVSFKDGRIIGDTKIKKSTKKRNKTKK